jgi:Sec-independent protein secretion pathway component TatC
LVRLTLPVGLIFQLPIMAFILAKIGILTSGFMKSYRRHAIVIIFILGAIITPPDLASQLLIAAPLIGLYEICIRVVKRIEKKRKKEEEKESLPAKKK